MFDLFLEVENFQHSRIFNQQEKKCHNFTFLSQTLIRKMNGIVKVDKCLNYHTFQKENHHQKYTKANK